MLLRTIRLFALFLLFGATERSSAFAPFGYTWNFGRQVMMHLNLGVPPQLLQDGASSWADSANDAMNIWNAQMDTARLVPADAVSSSFGDNVNTVQFSDTIYGESFGANVLALTLVNRVYANPSALCEAEVFFNNAKRFDSYRGPLQSDQNGPVYDFHRVALHEFGHCLGLLHPDEHDQTVVSIMNSVISDLDTLADDDITGIRSLYWVQVLGQTFSTPLALAQSFSYRLFADNNPSSFSASGLPPGLTIDPVTGIVSGKPLKSGTYDIQLAAYGPSSTISGTLRVTMPQPQITSASVGFAILGQPFSYQIRTDLEPIRFEANNLPPGLTLDPATGLISGIPTISVIKLGDLTVPVVAHGAYEDARGTISLYPYYPLPRKDPPLAVLNYYCDSLVMDPVRRRIYGVVTNASLRIIDGETLTTIKEFPDDHIADVRISNDGHTLWVGRYGIKSLARLDLDTLDAIVEVPAIDFLTTVNEGLGGRFYAVSGLDVVQLTALTGPVQQRITPSEGFSHFSAPQMALSPDKKTLYVADAFLTGNGSLVTHSAIARYDISSEIPALVQRVEMPAPNVQFTVSPDGESIYARLGHFDGERPSAYHKTVCLSAHDLTITKGAFEYEGEAGSLTISPDGKLAFQMTQVGDGGSFDSAFLQVFDTATFASKKKIVLGSQESFVIGMATPLLNSTGTRIIAGATLGQGSTPASLFVYDAQLPPAAVIPPKVLLNLSTRLRTQSGDDVLIGGFIVTGAEPKKVIVRAIGPSLPLAGRLIDPILELHGPDGKLIAGNDNWNEHRDDVLATDIPPRDEYESAIVATLPPGAYTAIVRGASATSGIAVVEIYDLSASTTSQIANISTRGKVDGGDNILFGGMIVGGNEVTKVAIRALGPSLISNGVANALSDPTLEVYDGHGTLIAQNDDWRSSQSQQLIDSGLSPPDDREAAVVLSLPPGNCTAVVRGKNSGSGVALVEIYNLDSK
jgi:hypothetical protein